MKDGGNGFVVRRCESCGQAVGDGDFVLRRYAVGTAQVDQGLCRGCADMSTHARAQRVFGEFGHCGGPTQNRPYVPERMRDDLALRERLASYAHEAWAGWMSYLLAKTRYTDDGGKKIEFSDVDRWKRLMETSYSDLKEDEKRSDRAQADKILAILLGSWWSDVPMGD